METQPRNINSMDGNNKNTIKPNRVVTYLLLNGPSVKKSKSFVHSDGASSARWGTSFVRDGGNPRNESGKLTGNAYCPGVNQTCAFGNFCAMTPA